MTARILKCLDLCEASGLFDDDTLRRERDYCAVMSSWPTIPIADCAPSASMYIRSRFVTFSLGGAMPIDAEGVAKYAATLTRVAALARECDCVLATQAEVDPPIPPCEGCGAPPDERCARGCPVAGGGDDGDASEDALRQDDRGLEQPHR